jgi:hypothetical protein
LPQRRVMVELATPELDPTSDGFKPQELVNFAHDLALPLLERTGLPASKPHIKLLFGSTQDATLAGASIFTTSLPVSVLGHQSAIGPRDGAFLVVAPTASRGGINVEAALADLLSSAGGRPVILLNPRLGNSPLLREFGQPAYALRMLSLAYLRDQTAQQIDRIPACVLRCHPHEWSVLVDIGPSKAERRWTYAGRFAKQPVAQEIEELLKVVVTRLRDADVADGGGLKQSADPERSG